VVTMVVTMKILAFDTSTRFLSIALLEDNEMVAEFHEEAGMRHSEILIPRINDTLEKAGWRIREIGLICAGTGPGSFTGLRIAVATVKGMAAVFPDKQGIGIPSMDAMVMNLPAGRAPVAPLLDARKGKVYSCVYELSGDEPVRVTDYLLIAVEELLGSLSGEVIFFGDAVARYREALDKHPLARYTEDVDWYPRAVHIGRLGFRRSIAGTDTPESLEPMYLHAKECNITKRKRG
ncbi:MAG: tRNA (adenosine(37)-N6)-threonylcarbamoyltransferase complex dimerization subunit type 1 TsaB, partial [Candidatus Omnitrophica bacterium]|nr:tRNA (adenosine(37)-N6)-threonylcarbamoyltransferase complex dimerization subunit type 1 TsaB [Candidatus Omnitrophota bacterium]